MKVAVVGSGVSGLAAAWLLNEHSKHDVHIFEADSRPGGHANTVDYTPPGKTSPVPVDTAFIVLNPVTYPNFLRFLKLKDVSVLPSRMTLSVSRDEGRFEWAGRSLSTVFCQPTRLLDPQMWSMLYDILRFNACAQEVLLDPPRGREISIGQYLESNGYSRSFRDNYLIPFTASVWSTPPDKTALEFPARTLIQFMYNHHLLQIYGAPPWLTIAGGSKVYVDKIVNGLRKDRLHLNTPVASVQSIPSGQLELVTSKDDVETFDHVILACHSDAALRILKAGNSSPEEARILSKFTWTKNDAVIHSDVQLMPKNRQAWACWNYLSSSARDTDGTLKANIGDVSVTFSMNDLQHISEKDHGPVFVTMNAPFEPRKDTIGGRWTYEHPVLDSDSVDAQREMPKIQNKRGISFAGAYLHYGFHEDGFTTGMRAAVDHLGVLPPFELEVHERRVSRNWSSHLFEIVEITGARAVIGLFFSCFLYLLRLPLGLLFDFVPLSR